jgi:F0F1-type ATP synthase assembly protein I
VEELTARRELHQGFGNAMGRAVELVGTPLLFAAFGLLLDRLLHWTPVLTAVFGLWGLAGALLRSYYAYNRQMREHEANSVWGKSR